MNAIYLAAGMYFGNKYLFALQIGYVTALYKQWGKTSFALMCVIYCWTQWIHNVGQSLFIHSNDHWIYRPVSSFRIPSIMGSNLSQGILNHSMCFFLASNLCFSLSSPSCSVTGFKSFFQTLQ